MRSAKSIPKFDRNPPVTWPIPAGIQVKYECSHGCRYKIATHAAKTADKPVDAMAKKFVTVRFFGCSGFANARTPLTSAPNRGSNGMSRRRLTIQLSRLVHIHGALQSVQL